MATKKKSPKRRRKTSCKEVVDQVLRVIASPVIATAAAFVYKELTRSRRRR